MLSLRTLLCALVALCAFAAPDAAAQAPARATVLRYETQVAGIGNVLTFGPQATFNFTSASPTDLQLIVSDGTSAAVLRFAPGAGQAFAVGPVELALPYFSHFNHPGIDTFPSSCTQDFARFVILETVFDSAFQLVSLAVDFNVHCAGQSVFGELRFNSAVPLAADKPSATSPDPFAFIPATGVVPGTLMVSNATSVEGIRTAAPISIVGGEYSVNGGPFTSASGMVNDHDRVVVRRAAAADVGTTVTATLTAGGVASDFNVTTFTPGQPFTAVTMDGPLNLGATIHVDARPPDWTITAAPDPLHGGFPEILASGPGGGLQITFGTDNFEKPGVYEEANDLAGLPFLDLGVAACTPVAQRFVIHEASAVAGVMDRLAMSFTRWCAGSQTPVFGEVRINSAVPLPSMFLQPHTTPYPFELRAQMPVAAGAIVRSNRIAIDGVNQPVPISIVGGEYSLNGGPFTSAPGVAHPRDDIVVQAVASRFPGGTRSATFTAGDYSATLNVQAYAPSMSLTGLYLQGTQPGGVTRLLLSPLRFTSLATIGGVIQFLATAPIDQGWFATIAAPGNAPLAPGPYEHAAHVQFQAQAQVQPGLDLQASSSFGCSQVFGRFDVREAVYDAAGNPQHLAVDFEHHCDFLAAPPTFGEMRYNSLVPFSALLGNACSAADPACVADMAVAQSFASSVDLGSTTTLTLTALNAGPAVGHNVVVSGMLPSSLVLAGVPPGCTAVAGGVSCVAAAIAPGSSVAFPLTVRGAADGPFTTTATVAAEEIDNNTANNAATASGTVHTDARVVNLSTRGLVITGPNVMIGGFVIGGTTPKTVVITAIGPSLLAGGVPNALPDPTLTLFRSSDGAVIAANDDWQAAPNAADMQAVGLAPADPHESAIMMTLPPGAYTAIVSFKSGDPGVGIVAVYEADHPESPLVNISTRGFVATGFEELIGGFIVQGTQPRTFVVTGIGPSLAAEGVAAPLADPVLRLVRSSDGATVATNDDWGAAANAAQLQALGLAPADAKESAILVTLEPGAYTALLSGVGGGAGVGLVAVYTLP